MQTLSSLEIEQVAGAGTSAADMLLIQRDLLTSPSSLVVGAAFFAASAQNALHLATAFVSTPAQTGAKIG